MRVLTVSSLWDIGRPPLRRSQLIGWKHNWIQLRQHCLQEVLCSSFGLTSSSPSSCSSISFKIYLFLFYCMYALPAVCSVPHANSAHGGQTTVSDLLGLGLQMTVRYHAGAWETNPGYLEKQQMLSTTELSRLPLHTSYLCWVILGASRFISLLRLMVLWNRRAFKFLFACLFIGVIAVQTLGLAVIGPLCPLLDW